MPVGCPHVILQLMADEWRAMSAEERSRRWREASGYPLPPVDIDVSVDAADGHAEALGL